ncbi:zinc finger domain-containing protein [Mycobacterium marinum]|uniref:zinc finger domain-containing protein n=1 Tax=Mycobacterium marinum TaxID=1781 RepID=UPI00045FC82A|nr:hypothetical protein MMARE11_19950 [Mycobacterium marinum E11]
MPTTTNPYPDALTVACPICGAKAGQECWRVDRYGLRQPAPWHLSRAHLAERRQHYAAELAKAAAR